MKKYITPEIETIDIKSHESLLTMSTLMNSKGYGQYSDKRNEGWDSSMWDGLNDSDEE